MARRIVLIVGGWLGAVILNVGFTVLWMVIYGNLINPGQPDEFYAAAAQRFGPYCGIGAGIPIFFVLGYLPDKKLNWPPAASILWGIYAFVDLSVLTIAGWSGLLAAQASVSMLTKLAAAIFGARLAGRN